MSSTPLCKLVLPTCLVAIPGSRGWSGYTLLWPQVAKALLKGACWTLTHPSLFLKRVPDFSVLYCFFPCSWCVLYPACLFPGSWQKERESSKALPQRYHWQPRACLHRKAKGPCTLRAHQNPHNIRQALYTSCHGTPCPLQAPPNVPSEEVSDFTSFFSSCSIVFS